VHNPILRKYEKEYGYCDLFQRDAGRGSAVVAGESKEADGDLTDIVALVGKVTDMVREIAAASQEQTGGIDQINMAVGQMDSVDQQAGVNAEEFSSAADELAGQTRQNADDDCLDF
jgi:hypothetical protein